LGNNFTSLLSESTRNSPLEAYKNLHAVIWTTTPWTLPANLAITLNSEVIYCIASPAGDNNVHYIVAEERVKFMEGILGKQLEIKMSFPGKLGFHRSHINFCTGKALIDSEYKNPIKLTNAPSIYPFITGDHVTTQSGTGLVHTAPGHGMEDFVICKEHGIQEVKCPGNSNS
jgi:isoleucyl-tRNA synthetase